ncbi:Conjugative transfer protein TrbB [Candidatus Burkholderia pumila]|uniref:Conjugative transfer protein TrbB n=1 Tax=Candidatus Burkholderia pumila TaxID=1090375 RepID=A0ABR5HM90_9BURK|nr:Conjugative transfer protein TrbB [Candidatus Burkholderia pumila]
MYACVTVSTNDERTAKRISETLGTATELRARRNYAGYRLAPWLGHLMVSRQETARPLLTPGEVNATATGRRRGDGRQSCPPIKAKKLRYYINAHFKRRVLPPPSLTIGRYIDAPPRRPDDWGGRAAPHVPTASSAPAFALRKRAVGVILLPSYGAEGVMTEVQAAPSCARRCASVRIFLVAGGINTGKTTLANALLAEIAATGDRVLVLEDTVELQCAARDHVSLRARAGEALDLIKVWGTGHSSGIAKIHADSVPGALLGLEQLILEVAVTAPRAHRRGGQRRHPSNRPGPATAYRLHRARHRHDRR